MKKTISFIIAVIMLTAIAGCQKTPESQIIQGKNAEQIIEKAVGGEKSKSGDLLAAQIGSADTYITEFSKYNNKLTIRANALVTVPDLSGISVVRVAKHIFTQAEADNMMKVFLQGETIYDISGYMLSKEEIEKRLIRYYGMRDGSIPMDLDGENPNDAGKLADVIAQLEAMLKKAEEGGKEKPAHTKLHTPDDAFNKNGTVIEGITSISGKQAYFRVDNGAYSDNGISATFINASAPTQSRYSAFPYAILDENTAQVTKPPSSFTLTEQNAQKIAYDALAALDIVDMVCVDTAYAVMSDAIQGAVEMDADTSGHTPTSFENAAWAYYFEFQRTVRGIPVTLTGHSGTGVTDESNYAKSWAYEKIEIAVDETGVIYFNYTSPYDIVETITENALLLSYNDIIAVFENMLPITHGFVNEVDYKLDIDISEVRLGLMRVTEQNSRDSGLLIPVWDFFGTTTVIPAVGEPYLGGEGMDSLLTINAVDGSIIDRDLGY